MKATGIVRRPDDLGRIVIPKEIRRKLRIKEGDPLEIFVDEENGSITFQRYFFKSLRDDRIVKMINLLNKATGYTIAISDLFSISDCTDSNLCGKAIPGYVRTQVESLNHSKLKNTVMEKTSTLYIKAQFPIVFDTEVIGALLILGYDDEDVVENVMSLAANYTAIINTTIINDD